MPRGNASLVLRGSEAPYREKKMPHMRQKKERYPKKEKEPRALLRYALLGYAS
jgi:hypothetical protein